MKALGSNPQQRGRGEERAGVPCFRMKMKEGKKTKLKLEQRPWMGLPRGWTEALRIREI